MRKLLEKLAEKKIRLMLHGDDLKVTCQDETDNLSDDILREIRDNKQALIEYIGQYGSQMEYEPIKPAEPAENYCVSDGQRQLWILSQRKEASRAYNMPNHIELAGDQSPALLEKAIRELIRRHEIFRTTFHETASGEVRQVIRPDDGNFKLDVRDYEGLPQEKVDQFLSEEARREFDLAEGPLLRAGLIRRGPDRYLFHYNMHHIISDGWSMEIVFREVMRSYDNYRHNKEWTLPPMRIQYKDYAVWQQRQLESASFGLHLDFWMDQLAGPLPILQFPADRPRPLLKTYNGSGMTATIGKNTARQLKAYCQEHKGTLFMGLLGSLYALFYRYTGQEDLIIGSPVAGREHAELEDQIGFYVNMLALRLRYDGSDSFDELFEKVQKMTLDAYRHQAYPLDRLLNKLPLDRDTSRSALFDVTAVLHNQQTNAVMGNEDGAGPDGIRDAGATMTKFDISFDFSEIKGGIQVYLQFNTDIYNKASMQRLLRNYILLLEQLLKNSALPLGRIGYIGHEERELLLDSFHDRDRSYPDDLTIADLFEQQVERTPDGIALTFSGQDMTYCELDRYSNQLAHYLQKKGVTSETLVPVCMERSMEMIVVLLGILKAGGAYVPVDPSYPAERIAHILSETGALLVLTDSASGNLFRAKGGAELIMPDRDAAAIAQEPDSRPLRELLPSGLAYVIYTSGSTGKPKGVMISHANVVRLFRTSKPIYDFTTLDTWTMFHSFCFDFSVWEMYGALFHGGRLVIVPAQTARDARLFLDLLVKEKVTILNMTPGAFYALSDEMMLAPKNLQIRYVIFGGEALNPARLSNWKRTFPGCTLVNMYGITETTVHVTYRKIEEADIMRGVSNIGQPIPTLGCYILDKERHLQPIGAIGEIYVRGDGLARGYLKNEKLTKDRFVDNPFLENDRLYRTGDLGRWLEDGSIEYMGRMDDQVKIRGYRIELGEIEYALQQFEGIRQNVVIARKDAAGDQSLIAFIVPATAFRKDEMILHLRSLLPEYMLPAQFVEVPSIPMTPNGKVDKKALPTPAPGIAAIHIAARSEMERTIEQVWSQVLGRTGIDMTDNFFQIGGDSIKAIRVVSETRKKTGAEISIHHLYQYNTIESLAAFLLNEKEVKDRQGAADRIRQELTTLRQEVLATHPQSGEIEDVYPMSDIQKGMLFASLADPESGIYHDQFIYVLPQEGFEIGRFTAVVQALADKHEILRTCFNVADYREEVQIVLKKITVKTPLEDLRSYSQSEQEEKIGEYMRRQRQRSYDFIAEPLWRVRLFRVDEDNIVCLLEAHHAILDGWSLASLITEFYNLYGGPAQKETRSLEKLRSSYKEAIIAERLDRENEENIRFWQQQLAGYKRLDVFSGTPLTAYYQHTYGNLRRHDLEQFSQTERIPLQMVLFAAALYSLSMLTHERDLTVGLVSHNRPLQEDGDKVLGCFLNTIPVRLTIPSGKEVTWRSFLHDVAGKVRTFQMHAGALVRHIQVPGETASGAGNPFFDIIFNFSDFHIYDRMEERSSLAVNDSGDLSSSLNLRSHTITNAWLLMDIDTTADDLRIMYTLTRDLKSGTGLHELFGYFDGTLTLLKDAPDKQMDKLNVIPLPMRQQLLSAWNDTDTDWPADMTIIDLFKQQSARMPDAAAVIFEDRKTSYRDLDERSDRLAIRLRNKGVRKGTPVPLCVDRSDEMMVALLGILKAGGAFVPIDPAYPKERITFMLKDIHAGILVTSEDLLGWLGPEESMNAVLLEEAGPQPDSLTGTSIGEGPDAGSLAYIIYTSGSTGRPKGVMITHRSLFNFLLSMARDLRFDAGDGLLAVTTYSFDISYLELLMPLIAGGTVYLASQEYASDGYLLMMKLQRSAPRFMQATPVTWQMLLDCGWDNREGITVLTGGEALSERLRDDLVGLTGKTIWNLYGPTETTIWSTAGELGAGEKVNIGTPIANTRIYILDDAGEMLPAGVAGEIYIGGVGVSQGYFHRETLTAERFVKDRFGDGEFLYRTGDLGRWLRNGKIECLGRLDQQVKIRGFRIEPGEIEHALLGLEGIEAAVVNALQRENNEKELVAYLVSGTAQIAEELRGRLKELLPDYMIPGYFVQLPHLPMTPNGKIDRKALPLPELAGVGSGQQYEAPRNDIEKSITDIWQKVLRYPKEISVNTDFFAMGGHSLRVMQLLHHIHSELKVRLPTHELFTHTTIAAQALLIARTPGTGYSQIEKVRDNADYALSDGQRRIWIMSQIEEASRSYHLPGQLYLEGEYDVQSLERSVRQLMDRHEILRTVFRMNTDGEVRQVILTVEETGFGLDYQDLSGRSLEERDEYIRLESLRPFELRRGPLFRAGLIKTGSGRYIFHYTMHHIISDRWSLELLKKEMLAYYSSFTEKKESGLPPLRIQYRDYAAWQRTRLQGDEIVRHRNYWLDQLSGELPLVDLPSYTARPAFKTHNGNSVFAGIGKELTDKLQVLCRENGATLFMGLLGALKVLLYRYTGLEDIVIGSPVAGRDDEELENQIGFYVNMLPLRTRFTGQHTFREMLEKVRQVTLLAYEHQAYPFDRLVEELTTARNTSRAPLFDILLNLQNINDPSVYDPMDGELTVFSDSIREVGSTISKFDLAFNFQEGPQGLSLYLEYNADIYESATITRLIGHYKNLLKAVTEWPDREVMRLEYISPDEKDQLLHAFNDTTVSYPGGPTVLDLFQKIVKTNPTGMAIRFANEQLSYSQLDRLSDRVGYYLQRHYAIGSDDLVCIKLDRSDWAVIVILGILKAGGAYLPVDPDYPAERIAFMVEDSNSRLVIDKEELARIQKEVYEYTDFYLEDRKTAGSNLAYVIYTSGSTGQPKGVLISHASLFNYISYCLEKYLDNPSGKWKIPLFTSLSFDLTVTSIFTSLLTGGELFVYRQEANIKDVLVDVFQGLYRINFVKCTPAHIQLLSDIPDWRAGGTSVERIILGGEELTNSHVALLHPVNPAIKIYNEYGPTETTVGCVVYAVQRPEDGQNGLPAPARAIPIGKPISNMYIRITDASGDLAPIGVVGELLIGGAGVGKGYLNRDQLTADRFINDPYDPGSGGKLYKSGDLARWLPDGNIEYLGRRDDQVKIRGYRVELGEIENVLRQYDGLREVVVVAAKIRDDKKDKELMAYFIADTAVDITRIKDFLGQRLPDHMIPRLFSQISEFPLTINGKIDRKRLSESSATFLEPSGGKYIAPRNETEQALEKIWQELLDIKDTIGVRDDFFQLGGHSIRALKILSRVSREFGVVIGIQTMFEEPTIERLAMEILNARWLEGNSLAGSSQENERVKI